MATGGYSRKEAQWVIEKLQRDAPGPYFLIGYSRLGDTQNLMVGNPLWSTENQTSFRTLLGLYQDFRHHVPSGRYSLLVAIRYDPAQTIHPQAIMVDTQLVGKISGGIG